MKGDFDLIEIAIKYGGIGKTGTIKFASPFYRLVCAELSIKYTDLSRLGKALLRNDCIDAYDMTRDELREKEYYLNLKKEK